ncbi:hypothetical protein BMF94_5887 [Rhodotorula taiwanensis]|uniref:C2H2-type domain-containing protein n=1 Tax=Rhodotorula taiwanensis TaxID=741276 RepID=A0A2S5B2Y3_9BASI|nr:hypothetical protein BMF94_5887 [Rhodotorula taiwanensis]
MASSSALQNSPPLAAAQQLAAVEQPAAGGDASTGGNPRKRAPSPLSISRQDAQRPFDFARRRSSSSFTATAIGNYMASPTSDLRSNQPLPTIEPAARSAPDKAPPPIRVVLSPSTSSHPIITESPMTSMAPMSLPSTSSDVQRIRPKGKGTLELERVLDMWAANTPTKGAFPASVALPFASGATTSAATSQPFLTHSIVSSEPEALDLAISTTRNLPGTSGPVFADFGQLASFPATAPLSRGSLSVEHRPPRRQRSRSEADLLRFDTMSLGGISLADFLAGLSNGTAPAAQSLNDPIPTQPFSMLSAPGLALEAGPASGRPQGLRLLPPAVPISTTGNTEPSPLAPAPGKPYSFSRGLELKITPAPPASGKAPKAARGRRARSQEPGHRHAKSDDLTHLLSTLPNGSASSQPVFASANGHLAPPPVYDPALTGQTSTGPALHLVAQQISPGSNDQGTGSRPEFISLPNGMTLPIAYFAPLPTVPGSGMDAPATAAPATTVGTTLEPDSIGHLPQFSPQGNALALAAAQAAQAHAAQIAQAAAVATLQYSNGGLSTDGIDVHSQSPFLPQPTGPYSIPTSAGGPYSYPSPNDPSLMLPTPPPVPGSSSRKTKRTARPAARTAAADDFIAADPEDPTDSSSDDGEDDDGDEYEDEPKPKKQRLAPAAPRASAPKKPGKGRAKAATKTPAAPTPDALGGVFANAFEGGSPFGGGSVGGADEEGEFSRESRTTQATIDAAQRRRNANAVAKFVCELCGETFTRRYNLRGHQRSHKGEKPYICTFDGCEKGFARAHDRKRHELLHLGVRKYHCSPCNRDFVRLDALHRHHRSEVGQACVKQLRAEGVAFDDQGAAIL